MASLFTKLRAGPIWPTSTTVHYQRWLAKMANFAQQCRISDKSSTISNCYQHSQPAVSTVYCNMSSLYDVRWRKRPSCSSAWIYTKLASVPNLHYDKCQMFWKVCRLSCVMWNTILVTKYPSHEKVSQGGWRIQVLYKTYIPTGGGPTYVFSYKTYVQTKGVGGGSNIGLLV